MEANAIRQELATLFEETNSAHHRAFAEADGADPDWPLWYASYVHRRLIQLFGPGFTRSELISLFVRAARAHGERGADVPWPTYYADYFIAELGKTDQTDANAG